MSREMTKKEIKQKLFEKIQRKWRMVHNCKEMIKLYGDDVNPTESAKAVYEMCLLDKEKYISEVVELERLYEEFFGKSYYEDVR